jgi:hypothetical protein
MTTRTRGIRLLLICGSVVALGAGFAYAAIPGSNGVINACYEKRTGLLRVIDAEAGKRCLSFESPISWNQQGAGGSLAPVIRVGELAQAVSLAHCRIGEVATGGGGVTSGPAGQLAQSFPLNGEAGTTPTGWAARTSNPDGFVRAYAVCADPGA